MDDWIDRGTYYLSRAEQLSDRWKALRDYRLTAANFGAAVGHCTFPGKGPKDIADFISGRRLQEFSEGSLELMNHGIKTEPEARRWYEQQRGVTVHEVGLAIPKWDLRIGASLDGEVEDGSIEIKCPKVMYWPLKNYRGTGYDHIWKSHYDQMQGGMAITGKKWCDYIVYCTPENSVFLQRIPFDRKYWETSLYPEIQKFLNNHLPSDLVGKRIDPKI